jgi:ATP-dependent DNA helicase RecG
MEILNSNWAKPIQTGDVTIDTLEAHTKNPLITKVFREMSGRTRFGQDEYQEVCAAVL